VTLARECPVNTTEIRWSDYYIESQDDFHAKWGKECTIILGSQIVISDAYQGVLDLSGVANITASLRATGANGLTNVIVDDLEYIRSVSFLDTAVLSISFPKLQTTEDIDVKALLPTDVDLPALVSGDLSLKGNIKR